MCKISAQYVKAWRRKLRKTVYLRKTVTGGRRHGRTDGWMDWRTSPYHNTSRLKMGVLIYFQNMWKCLQKLCFPPKSSSHALEMAKAFIIWVGGLKYMTNDYLLIFKYYVLRNYKILPKIFEKCLKLTFSTPKIDKTRGPCGPLSLTWVQWTRQKFDIRMEPKTTKLHPTCFKIIAMHSVCCCSLLG